MCHPCGWFLTFHDATHSTNAMPDAAAPAAKRACLDAAVPPPPPDAPVLLPAAQLLLFLGELEAAGALPTETKKVPTLVQFYVHRDCRRRRRRCHCRRNAAPCPRSPLPITITTTTTTTTTPATLQSLKAIALSNDERMVACMQAYQSSGAAADAVETLSVILGSQA